jgi:transcriptional regulator with XRE-family HTH domain
MSPFTDGCHSLLKDFVIQRTIKSPERYFIMSRPYKSPRMLVRTTIALRRNVKDQNKRSLSQAAFADEIHLSRSALSDLEQRKTSLGLDYLTRLQLHLGVPNGIILCIAHIAAMSRDASTLKGPARKREIAKLALMADYLSNLARRVRSTTKQLSRFPKVSRTQQKSWDRIIEDLIGAAQRGHNRHAASAFVDRVTLDTLFKPYAPKRTPRPRNGPNGAEKSGRSPQAPAYTSDTRRGSRT